MKKYLPFLLFSLLICSCSGKEVADLPPWGFDPQTISGFIESDEYKGIGKINILEDSGAPYFLSFVMSDLGRETERIKLLEMEIAHGPYAEEAAQELFSTFSQKEQWVRLISTFKPLRQSNPQNDFYNKAYEEILYKSGRSSDVKKLAQMAPASLYPVMARVILLDEGWQESVSTFVYGEASFQDIYELSKLLKEMDLFHQIPDHLKYILETVSAYNEGDDLLLQESLGKWQRPEDHHIQSPFYYKLRLPAQRADLEEQIAAQLEMVEDFAALFTAGRLYKNIRRYDKADTLWRQARKLARSDYEKDRSTWYLLNLYKSNISYLTTLMEETSLQWNDKSYFSDILLEHLSSLAGKRQWQILERMYPLVLESGENEVIASYSWVYLLSPLGEQLSQEEKENVFEHLTREPFLSFYNILGTVLAGEEIGDPQLLPMNVEEKKENHILSGFLEFSLEEEALEYSEDREDLLSEENLLVLIELASEKGDALRSIQLASYLRPSIKNIKYKYPFLYQDHIENYAQEFSFPPEILSGVIRTESAFSPEIESHAGAVGLSQLMPETAADQARKLKLENPDLTDPETNIHIGSSYIRWILNRPWNDNLSQMLIAYNAGGGNLRKWKRIYPGYSDELFAEVIPYEETRNYVKKVLTSSVVYGSVYGGESPEIIIEKIFPDILNHKLNK